MERKYKVVEIDAEDHKHVYVDGGIEKAYTLDEWDHVLILQVGPNFNINANAGMIRRTFGYGHNRPVIFTRSPMRFFTVAPVEAEAKPTWWSRFKAWLGFKPTNQAILPP